MLEISGKEKRALRGRAHALRPVVHVGQGGLSAAVIAETDAALNAHELIKVRLHAPQDKRGAARELAAATDSTLCGVIGHTVILYRPNPDGDKPGDKKAGHAR